MSPGKVATDATCCGWSKNYNFATGLQELFVQIFFYSDPDNLDPSRIWIDPDYRIDVLELVVALTDAGMRSTECPFKL